MYYGYSDKEKILMADREFIELLGLKTINDIIKSDIFDNVKFENGKLYITLKEKTIKANFIESILYSTTGEIR